jgi:hypothetical protein
MLLGDTQIAKVPVCPLEAKKQRVIIVAGMESADGPCEGFPGVLRSHPCEYL